MTDNPYSFDFLQTIVGVHFGSDLWLGIATGVNQSYTPPSVPNVDIAVRLGTIGGFVFYTAGHANTAYPISATAKKLTPTSHTDAPASTKLTGYVVQGGILIDVSRSLPNRFKIVCTCAADTTIYGPNGGGATVSLLPKTAIAPGQDIYRFAEALTTRQPMTAHRNFVGPGGTTLTFTVDVAKKTVTGSGGYGSVGYGGGP